MNEFTKKILSLTKNIKNENEILITTNSLEICYIAGISPESNCWLCISKTSVYLGIDNRYVVNSDDLHVVNFNDIPQELRNKNVLISQNCKYLEYLHIKQGFKAKKISCVNLFQETHAVKFPYEISIIKYAAKICKKTIKFLNNFIKNTSLLNISEKDLARIIDINMLQNGADGIAFNTIVAFGANAATPHHKTSDKKYQVDDIILCDFGIRFNGYCIDVSRTFCFTKDQKNAANLVKKIKKIIENMCLPNTQCSDISKYICNTFDSKIDVIHSLGHGIGMNVHEFPNFSSKSKDILCNNMVFTIEPGIYIPNKFGVRIEDTYAILNNKLLNLTKI